VDRKQRHLQDDLRYALKKMPEPLDLNAPFEDAVPAMEKLAEWQPLDDEGRRSAFSKFVKRQKVYYLVTALELGLNRMCRNGCAMPLKMAGR
jgi:hypothetical protein